MNLPWILGAVGFVAFFAYFEARAFRHPDRQNTLSRFVFNIGQQWPLSIFLLGLLCGGLAVHFFWHWCPDQGLGTGMMIAPHVPQNCTLGPAGTNTINCPLVGVAEIGAVHFTYPPTTGD